MHNAVMFSYSIVYLTTPRMYQLIEYVRCGVVF